MKTNFNPSSTCVSAYMSARNFARNSANNFRRIAVLLVLLLSFAFGARAADYVISYTNNDGTTYYLGMNGNELRAKTTFDLTCIWTCLNGNTETTLGNQSRSLRNKNNNAYYLTTSCTRQGQTYTWEALRVQRNASNIWRSSSHPNGNVYAYYSSSNRPAWNRSASINVQSRSMIDNNTNSSQNYAVTTENQSQSISTEYNWTGPTIIPTSVTLNFGEKETFNASATAKRITRVIPEHTTYSFNSQTYYYYNEKIYNSTDAFSTQNEENLTVSYNWGLAGTGSSNLSMTGAGNNCIVTYSTAATVDASATLTVTASATGATNQQATATITIHKKLDDPTSITANNLTLAVDEQKAISYTLQPPTAYDKVDYKIADESIASVSDGGMVTGKKAGSTQITITAYKIDGVTPACSTTCTVTVMQRCETPVVTINSTTQEVTITSSTEGATIYYTTDDSDPTESSSKYNGSFTVGNGVIVKAIAVKDGWLNSNIGSASSGGSGETASDPYYIASVSGLNYMAEHPTYHFKVVADFDASGFSSSITNFSGTLDGDYKVISGLSRPLFTSTNGATIKNVVLDDVNISVTGNVGAIVATASGATRIYNCGVRATNGSTISGTDYTGSIVGHLQGGSRVINCYSFADITGGTTVGGIVGYNATASTSSNLQTLVMNCMYYGDIKGGTNKAPIYNGQIITNAGNTGINNYNYYRYSSPYSLNKDIDTYNCALAAEERYLVRHEFYRGILNSQRKLCAYYVKGSVADVEEIDKWVLDPEIAPYPIIKPWGKYPSIINKVPTDPSTPYQGKVLGNLSVNISGYGTVQLPITDMDTLNYDYNYYKVQLPYYNDYFDDQYVNNKVVTGWKITSVTGGNAGTFSTSGDDRYNFADRNCTQKDLYSVTGIVFAQGGYYNVPEGVTGITIEPYIATNVAYLSDPYYDKVYNTSYTGYNFTVAGNVPTTRNGKTVYNGIANAINGLGGGGSTVYDNAIVLVGNYHSLSENWTGSSKRPFTLMSIDEDKDNEPDYCVFHGHETARVEVNPVRFDFLWHPGIGMAKKVTGSGVRMPNQSIFCPLGWFEITETCLARYTEFEYDYNNASRTASPMILNNGVFEQFMSLFDNGGNSTRVTYMRLGGNVYFEAFTPGTHTKYTSATTHVPISVCGGEYKSFYLSGVKANANTIAGNALCYTNGGRFPMFAGAYMEKIAGDVIVKMDHSFVDEFYGGGVNSISAQITGDINITINNSLVRFYCGGPKFGSMATGKSVTTNATGTTFGEFYGAGYGGTSYFIDGVLDEQHYGVNTFNNGSYNGLYTVFGQGTNGYQTNYHLEYFSYAGGTGTSTVSRFYRHYASLTFATTNNVTSTLTNCVVEKDFYGGGHLGVVDGTATSTLDNCVVKGSAYGGGYSAAIPTCIVRTSLPSGYPTFNANTGVFEFVDFPDPEYYTWSQDVTAVDQTNKLLPTDQDLSSLGSVKNNTIITINGKTFINAEPESGVYGGGNASKVSGQTNVIIEADANSKINNVFGGANQADVDGATVVTVNSGNVGNVFGANNQSGVKGNTVTVNVLGATSDNVYGAGNLAPYTGSPAVNILNGKVNQNVYGGGLGASAVVTGNPQVIIGDNDANHKVSILGDVYGGGDAANVEGTPVVKVINDCNTEIGNVYGGGNAAHVKGTDVTIQGGVIDMVFGGGHGDNTVNPQVSADVNGNVNVKVTGGTISKVFGGSNSLGNISGTINLNINKEDASCPMNIEEVYGGGNLAAGNAGIITIGCTGGEDEGIGDVYGGANAADINSDITLNITGGNINRVFGGNNTSGNISGTITVNVDESGACPLTLSEVYGAGNMAAYDAPDGKLNYPQVNIVKGAITNTVYGGGLGSTATVKGNPNVNMSGGTVGYTETVDAVEVVCAGDIFGGGNAAAVDGSTKVVITGGNVLRNVYGGGSQAKVTGQTNVVIGG